ncbi:MAG: DMT family transporter, partial [Bdellovibrionales bacterium]|nr:DMT family transporter [Bdellovibrionales bacterium]
MAYLSIAFAAILWSTGGVLIKTIDWNPMAISAVRSGIAILVIAAFYRSRTYKLTWSSIFGAASYAACLITFVSATKFTTAANAIFLQYSAPVFVAIMSGVVLKENVRREQWLCIIWALCGLGVFFLDDLDTKGTFGNILGLLSGISFAAMI